MDNFKHHTATKVVAYLVRCEEGIRANLGTMTMAVHTFRSTCAIHSLLYYLVEISARESEHVTHRQSVYSSLV